MNEPTAAVTAFLTRWEGASGSERANYQLFLTEFCTALELPLPEPAQSDAQNNAYCFERRVIFQNGDGTQSDGFIDLYRRACFVLEAKQTGLTLDTERWDKAMLRAHSQAVRYARAVPPDEGRPPFVVVVDVGRSIELYSEFSRSGGAYIPYPDVRSHRIRLTDLHRPDIRQRLRQLWLDPLDLDLSRHAARVTRAIADQLAGLATSLETTGHPPEVTAAFLMRCLFTLFAQDIGLLKKDGFTELLRSVRQQPAQFVPLVETLWREMNSGSAFSLILRQPVLRFNGGLFAEATALPLNRDQLELLTAAACADWQQVEPAIFGTLLERALDPLERQQLGAHYTPRAYVERLVVPTVIAPLREDWTAVRLAAFSLHEQGKDAEAAAVVNRFQAQLTQIRVLDPACGSGNFLYVTLEHLKRLEGEVLDTLASLGQQSEIELAGVSPQQLLGLERNPRAATIAEMVLWIGYLQWHIRTHGSVHPPEPVIRDCKNIQCRDAVLSAERVEVVTDDAGLAVTRWDGRTLKRHPTTGELIPDESARLPLERYVNPRRAAWPAAEFIVGNPPFIGAATMRRVLGDGYVDALRGAWSEVPESADYVLYWWEQAAELTRSGQVRRFGLITTNSLRQTFNRRVLERHLTADPPLSLLYAVPDHPWVDGGDGAAVRIAMTVGAAGALPGVIEQVTAERSGSGEGLDVEMLRSSGLIHADLRIGADVAGAVALQANGGISFRGIELGGAGFIVTPEEATALGLGRVPELAQHIRLYLNGRDLLQTSRNVMVIDLFGLTAEEVLTRYPEVYQRLLERVKPERDQNRSLLLKQNWWLHRRLREDLRTAISPLSRYIATVETAKQRIFVFLDQTVLPDNKLINIAIDDAWVFGVLSSQVHVAWALANGASLGLTPVYVKTRCFETFPFPDLAASSTERIRQLGEHIDAHRKARQALHPALTLTGMYNVLEQLRDGKPLTAQEKVIHEQGLVAILRQLHDELDAAVLTAYGWEDLIPPSPPFSKGGDERAPFSKGGDAESPPLAKGGWGDLTETLLQRLVTLNAARVAEERAGNIRWLRPAFQHPTGATAAVQAEADLDRADSASASKRAWPKTLPEQFHSVRAALAAQSAPISAAELAKQFTPAPRAKLKELLTTLVSLGHIRQLADGGYLS
ncbi:SAM-dependent methyltransferase [Chromatium okenii]|uniref:class I SAM-dependent DNA methyltransferase n=1 Tax=Chromatium okenii TaxID=61644 RepID=UPI001906814F|nr:class I SAM-dependent DNA methyltransferase [Chromatium okenii]MBK1640965.1 SAM-dependent methyltransferase [Chromatium okenii]